MSKKQLTAREAARLKSQKMIKKENGSNFFKSKIFITFATILAIGAFVATMLIVGQNQADEDREKMAPIENLTPKRVDAKGAFYYSPKGLEKPEENSKKTRVDSFFDPQCPGCGSVDRAIGPKLVELTEANEIDLFLTPVSFLDNASTDRYSTRATNAFVTVAEESPKHMLKFMNAIYEEDFQPAEGLGRTKTDSELSAKAVEVGVPQETADKIKNHSYFEWIEKQTETQTNRSDLFPTGFSTPSVFLDVEYSDNEPNETQFTKVAFEGGDSLEVFTKAYENSKN